MAGNLYEWVQDEGHQNYQGAPNDGSGWCTETCPENSNHPMFDNNMEESTVVDRVMRGGSWGSNANNMRVTGRYYVHPLIQNKMIGGRLAR